MDAAAPVRPAPLDQLERLGMEPDETADAFPAPVRGSLVNGDDLDAAQTDGLIEERSDALHEVRHRVADDHDHGHVGRDGAEALFGIGRMIRQQPPVYLVERLGLGLPGPALQHARAVVRRPVARGIGEYDLDHPDEVLDIVGAEHFALAERSGRLGHCPHVTDDHGEPRVGVLEELGDQCDLVVRPVVDRNHAGIGRGQERHDLIVWDIRQDVDPVDHAEFRGAGHQPLDVP